MCHTIFLDQNFVRNLKKDTKIQNINQKSLLGQLIVHKNGDCHFYVKRRSSGLKIGTQGNFDMHNRNIAPFFSH